MNKKTDKAKTKCAHVSMVAINELRENSKNANRHSARQIELLAKNIRELGWRHPIIVSKRSGYIVAGHARLEAARLLGESQVPVDYQDFESDEKEAAYLVADNRIAELAEMDGTALKDLLAELESKDVDVELSGYGADEIEEILNEKSKLKKIEIQRPPKMAWVLIGVPIGEWAKISKVADDAANIPGSIVETTANDGI